MINIRYILFFVLIGIISCNRTNNSNQDEIVIEDYSIMISFSSFWDCGEFKKYILDNKGNEDPSQKEVFKRFNLYRINIKGNCKPPIQLDTLITKLTKNQSDSLFDLSNRFIDNFKLNNRIKLNQRFEKVSDGANVKMEICLLNRIKSATYYNYGHLKEVSPEMKDLIEYIDLITKEK